MKKIKNVVNIELEDMETEVFYNVSGFERAYKKLKNNFYTALGLDGNNLNLRSGMVILLMNNHKDDKWFTMTSGTKADMKDYIKKYEFNNFKLLIKANTWQITR